MQNDTTLCEGYLALLYLTKLHVNLFWRHTSNKKKIHMHKTVHCSVLCSSLVNPTWSHLYVEVLYISGNSRSSGAGNSIMWYFTLEVHFLIEQWHLIKKIQGRGSRGDRVHCLNIPCLPWYHRGYCSSGWHSALNQISSLSLLFSAWVVEGWTCSCHTQCSRWKLSLEYSG